MDTKVICKEDGLDYGRMVETTSLIASIKSVPLKGDPWEMPLSWEWMDERWLPRFRLFIPFLYRAKEDDKFVFRFTPLEEKTIFKSRN